MVRVTTNSLTQRILANLNQNLVRYSNLQNQLSTGKRITRPSDNPSDFALSLRLRNSYNRDLRFERNIDRAKTYLDVTESTIASISDAVGDLLVVVQSAGNPSVMQDGRLALAGEVREAFNQILQLANTSFGNNYIFGGNETQTKPFAEVSGFNQAGAVLYSGDFGARLAEISPGELFKYNLDGSESFYANLEVITSDISVTDTRGTLTSQLPPSPPPSGGNYAGDFTLNGKTITVSGTDTLESLKNKINLANVDVIAEIDDNNKLVLKSQRSEPIQIENGTSNILTALGMQRTVGGSDIGAGVTAATPLIGLVPPLTAEAIEIETDSGSTFIDLSSAVTVGDVLTLINNSGVGVEAYLNSSGTGFEISTTTNSEILEISDVKAIFGTAIGVAMNDQTTLASLGIVPGEVEIVNDSFSAVVDLSSAVTIGDIQTLLQNAGAAFDVSINDAGTGLNISTLLESSSIEIREVGAGTTAFDLGIIGTSNEDTATAFGIEGEGSIDRPDPVNLFDAVLDLEDYLLSGTGTDEELNEISDRLTLSFDYLLQARTRIGTRVRRMESETLRLGEVQVQSARLISLTEDADLAETITLLNIQENVYTAALNAASRIITPSLLDFLR